MIDNKRVFVIFYVIVLVLAPVVSISLVVLSPVNDAQRYEVPDTIQESTDILSKLKNEGIEFDDIPLSTEDVTLPFGGFIQNLGQIPDDTIDYYYSSSSGSVGFSDSKITFTSTGLDSESVRFSITFPGSNIVTPEGTKKKVHVVNYILGDRQQSNIPTFGEVLYSKLYDGIDLRYYMTDRGLKYEFLVHPGADPSQITLKVSDAVSVAVDEKSVSFILEAEPIFQDTGLDVFQEDGTTVPTRFSIVPDMSNCYGFQVDSYDYRQILTIDPWFLPFSTFVTFGWMGDSLDGIAVDADGNCYVTGNRYLDFWPENRKDLYIGKHAPNGTPIWSSYYRLGDDDVTVGQDIEIDSLGNAYLCGYTDSYTFPDTPNANDTSYNGGLYDAFVIKMNATGGIEYATYLGGNDADYAYGIDFDPVTKEICVVGITKSNNFPMQDAYDSTQSGETDGFVVKYTADGSEFVYSTFLGGGMKDTASGVDVDSEGYCYVTGYTNSSDFPTSVGSWDTLHGGGDYDAFITILDPDGQGFNQSAYLGGVDDDWGNAVVVGDDGRCYIVGYSRSVNYPITSQIQSYHDEYDAFLTVSTESHDTINMSTFIGTDSNDYAGNVILGPDDKVYIVGGTYNESFIQVNPSNGTFGGSRDTFVMRINAELDTIEFSTFLGGIYSEFIDDVGVDSSGSIYVVGYTSSPDFPLVREIQDYGEGFLTKLAEDTTDPVITLISPETSQKIHGGMHVDLDVTDDWYVDTVWYNWDNGENYTVDEPFDVPCTFEKTYILRVYANDSAGNEVSATYNFLRGTTFFSYSTFMGGGNSDRAWEVILDSSGCAYVVGETYSVDFPTLNPYNDTHGGLADIFLSKFSPTGELLFSTYIGGSSSEMAHDVAIDGSGNIYICGQTASDVDFPLVNAQNSTHGGGTWDAILMALDSTGANLLFSTYLGGNYEEVAFALELDTTGNVYVVGYTTSTDFPTVNAYDETRDTLSDVFLTEYNPSGQSILYSTYIGGDNLDQANDIAIDLNGYCYIVGGTLSSDFPTQNALNSSLNGGHDFFITKIKPGEGGLNYSTYLGSTDDDIAYSIVVDASGSAYFTGWAEGSDYPLKNEIQTHQGDRDIAITGINSTGTGVIFSTYLGSSTADYGYAITLGLGGHVYIAGRTLGNGIPMSNALDASHAGNWDAFVARLKPTYDGIGFATLLGGPQEDAAWGIDVHSDGSIVIVGNTYSDTFPTADAFNDTYSGSGEAFVTRIGFDVTGPTVDDPSDFNVQVGSNGNTITWTPDDPNPDSYTVLVNGTVWDEGEWNPDDDNITVGIDGLPEGVYNVTIIVYDEGGNGETGTIWVTVVNDTTWPTIDHPDNIVFDEGTTGHWITWTPYDEYPSNYIIYRNGEVINDDPWSGGPVAILIDGLPYGSYNHTIVVWDVGGNWQKDTVWINVEDGTAPLIDYPDDIIYEEGSTGHWLTWTPTDAHPVSYEIFRNGTSLDSDVWDGSPVMIQIDGLSLGVYNYTLVVTDIGGFVRWRTTYVTVIDATPPVMDSPSDIEYEEGETGNEITWTPSDLNPASYEILLNDVSIFDDDWTGGTITFVVDGFSPGAYNFTLVVTDVGSNTASDSVIVTVSEASTTPPTTTTTTPTLPPEGVDIVVIIIILGAGGAILVIIIYACKKKTPGE